MGFMGKLQPASVFLQRTQRRGPAAHRRPDEPRQPPQHLLSLRLHSAGEL